MAEPDPITDSIIAATRRALEKRRIELDGDKGLSNVTLLIRIDSRNREARDVVFRKESIG